jgi:hypothetical protein
MTKESAMKTNQPQPVRTLGLSVAVRLEGVDTDWHWLPQQLEASILSDECLTPRQPFSPAPLSGGGYQVWSEFQNLRSSTFFITASEISALIHSPFRRGEPFLVKG